jgi:hypothetical protein
MKRWGGTLLSFLQFVNEKENGLRQINRKICGLFTANCTIKAYITAPMIHPLWLILIFTRIHIGTKIFDIQWLPIFTRIYLHRFNGVLKWSKRNKAKASKSVKFDQKPYYTLLLLLNPSISRVAQNVKKSIYSLRVVEKVVFLQSRSGTLRTYSVTTRKVADSTGRRKTLAVNT